VLNETFTLPDGRVVSMADDVHDTLNSLEGSVPGKDEYAPANSGTWH
jgi:hypothetical protein